MTTAEPEATTARTYRLQQNLFATIAVVSIALVSLALPRKVANYRELKAVNARLVELQGLIVDTQIQIRAAEGQLIQVQGKIAKQTTK